MYATLLFGYKRQAVSKLSDELCACELLSVPASVCFTRHAYMPALIALGNDPCRPYIVKTVQKPLESFFLLLFLLFFSAASSLGSCSVRSPLGLSFLACLIGNLRSDTQGARGTGMSIVEDSVLVVMKNGCSDCYVPRTISRWTQRRPG